MIVSLLDFEALDTVWFLECSLWVMLPFAMKDSMCLQRKFISLVTSSRIWGLQHCFYFAFFLFLSVQNGSFCWSKFLKNFVPLSPISLRAIPLEKSHIHRFFLGKISILDSCWGGWRTMLLSILENLQCDWEVLWNVLFNFVKEHLMWLDTLVFLSFWGFSKMLCS